MIFSMRSFVSLVATVLVASGCGTLTVQKEKEIGREVQRAVRQQLTFVRDPVTVRYVRAIGSELATQAPPSPFEFRFYVVEDETLNAFAVPGGGIYLHSGLIQATRSASELSGVMAHEIGHVTARHFAERYNKERSAGIAAQIGAFIIAILTGSRIAADAGQIAMGMAHRAYITRYSREDEREADDLGLATMVRAGWDPNGMVTMFETMRDEHQGGFAPQFLISHPTSQERIDSTRAAIAQLGSLDGLRSNDGGRLDIIKQRLELIIGTDIEDFIDDEDSEDDFEDDLEDDEVQDE